MRHLVLLFIFAWSAAASPRHLEERLIQEGFQKADLEAAVVRTRFTSSHNGVEHFYYRQAFKGLEIWGADMSLHLDKQGEVLTLNHAFEANLARKRIMDQRVLPADLVVEMVAEQLGLGAVQGVKMLKRANTADRATELTGGTVSRDRIPAKLMYFPDEPRILRLAWELVIQEFSGLHWWQVIADARTGKILDKRDWVKNESYRIFPLPLLNPFEGGRVVVSNEAEAVASPFGWHDTDGVAGPEFFDTRGNNVLAQEDIDANNSGGSRPDGGPSLTFDFPLDFALGPTSNVAATVAQLFYMNNIAHDVFYQYGFTEAAGNFQENNYGRGGIALDGVRADALDGSGVNNANFSAPPDGITPRMQMFVWRASELEVTSPGGIAGQYPSGSAEFGEHLIGLTMSGMVVQARDDSNTNGSSITDCCTAVTNIAEVTGRIALIDRGDCLFTVKVKNAQDAGAIGVIMVNNAGDEVITMGGSDPTITIPSVFVGQGDGNTIRAQLSNNVNVVLSGGMVGSSYDSGIVVHEYGHGVSSRLTGGANNSGCLDGIQSGGMGEGWSDWWSLVFTAKPSDSELAPRGVGNFVVNQPSAELGIRRFPYSTDLGINPLTYRWVINSAEEHDVGEIWCAVLYDMYWILVSKYGFDPDLYFGVGGNNIALQLVMDGLKLQPCSPTFLQARDALLAADQATYGGVNQCEIWRAFARRGMGENATDGGSHNSTNVVEDFSLPDGCRRPVITSITDTEPFNITWLSLDGELYRVQRSPSLLNPAWTNVSGSVTSPGISASSVLPSNTFDRAYYRIVLPD